VRVRSSRGIAIAQAASGLLLCILFFTSADVCRAQQSQLPADSMEMTAASHATTWTEGRGSVVELHGPIDIKLDHARLTADNAVVWLSRLPGGLLDEQRVEIALMGHAKLTQENVVRTEDNLLVNAVVTGAIRLSGERSAVDDQASELYQQATAIRRGQTIAPTAATPAAGAPHRRWSTSSTTRRATTAPAGPPPIIRPKRAIELQFDNMHEERTDDGNLAFVLSGNLMIRSHSPNGDLLEFLADNAVVFTDLKNLKDAQGGSANQRQTIGDHVVSAYFEGDVRVYTTPADGAKNILSMRAERVYYEFATDRAVLTDVVFHTIDLKKQIPVYMRAQTVRQLSQGEFKAENVQLTTSGFATPSYSLAAQKAYVRSEATGDPSLGERVTFGANNAFLDVFGVPIFYLPAAGGTMTSRGSALREISVEDSHDFGFGVRSEWGLFETLGQPPPPGLDTSVRADYFSDRGPAGGVDAKYNGGFVTETTKDPWNFLGDLHSYFVDDHGTDDLGASRTEVTPPDEFRGRAYIEHQHFFPNDWQAQIRLGWVSDANFLWQWFPEEYRNGLPIDESIYLKHQKDSEVFTLLTEWQPNDQVTTSEAVQEQREVQYLPQVGYHRIGDSFADDTLTFISDNTAGGLQFARSGATLQEQGFVPAAGVQPGIPSYAYTGDPNETVWRGDFRQEVDWPINAGPIKMVPYAFGRYTTYSAGVVPPVPNPTAKALPTAPITKTGDQNRFMAGTGIRFTTAFWKTDNSVESDLFDVHRVRHVIEPEINLFTSAQTIDQQHLFIYNENVDAVNDIQAVEFALRQRWQTKRGGPGRWRSADFFTFNVYTDLFANQPDKRFRDPVDFRGQFFSTTPETSLARNAVNADSQWRLSDTTTVLADFSENLDKFRVATASVGVAVQRDERLTYFIGQRYIDDLNSSILTFEAMYKLTRKYDVLYTQSFDFGQNKSVFYTFALTRRFDRFSAGVRAFYDQSTDNKGFSFVLMPYGLNRGIGTQELERMGT
jgi:hypothetical protein